jgi:hypothetical protein
MLKRWFFLLSMLTLMSLVMTPLVVAAESAQTFRQKNGLLTYAPPAWFLQGYFIARERNPGYIFGTVQDFVKTLDGMTTWLIEDLELKRLEVASAEGKNMEYSLYLEVVSAERVEYWVFVVLPHDSAQEWFDARRAYHGRKAEGYYGKTRGELEHALSQGLKIKGELRFLIEQGDISLASPEDVIMTRYNFQPIFDLSAGRWLGAATKNN